MIWQAAISKALVYRGVLLNDWIIWKKQLVFIYYLQQNTWIPRWIISGKMTWEKKSVSCESNLSSRTGKKEKPGKKNTLFSDHLPLAASD